MFFTLFQDFSISKKCFYVIIFTVILSTFNEDTYFECPLSSWDHTMKHKRNTDYEAIKSQFSVRENEREMAEAKRQN